MNHPSANSSEELVPESAPVLGPAVSSSAEGGPSPLGALDEPLAPFRPGTTERAPAEAPLPIEPAASVEAPLPVEPATSMEAPLPAETAAPTDEPGEAVALPELQEPLPVEPAAAEEEMPAAGEIAMPWELPAPTEAAAPEPVAMDEIADVADVDDEFPVFPAGFEPVEAAEPEAPSGVAPEADDEVLPFEHDIPAPAAAAKEHGWDIESELGLDDEAAAQAGLGADDEGPWTVPPVEEEGWESGEGPVAPGGTAAPELDDPSAAPALQAVADRLERIARSLRERTADDLLAGGDPLEILIAGYALGYADALRRSPGERRPLD